jgi:nucleoside phosphorylase
MIQIDKQYKLFLFPTPLELKTVMSFLSPPAFKFERNGVDNMRVWQDEKNKWLFASSGLGKAESAMRAQYLIDRLSAHPSCVILVGSCGSLRPEFEVGDWVQVTRGIEFDFTLENKKTFEYGMVKVSPMHGLPEVTMLSGELELKSAEKRTKLVEQYGADVISWEGAAISRVARFNKIPFIETRFISDLSDKAMTLEDFEIQIRSHMKKAPKVFEAFKELKIEE